MDSYTNNPILYSFVPLFLWIPMTLLFDIFKMGEPEEPNSVEQ